MKTNRLHTSQSMRCTLFAAALAVIVLAAIVIGRRHATPSPLTPQETREVIAAISLIAPGSKVANVRRDPDGFATHKICKRSLGFALHDRRSSPPSRERSRVTIRLGISSLPARGKHVGRRLEWLEWTTHQNILAMKNSPAA